MQASPDPPAAQQPSTPPSSEPPARRHRLRPPFDAAWQLWTFLAFVFFLLVLPLAPKGHLVDREKLYFGLSGGMRGEVGDARGSYGYFANHTLQGSGPIDVLFLGHSSIECGIDPDVVKAALRPLLGREAVVYIAGHPQENPGYDFVALSDLLDRRPVRLLVLHRNQDSRNADLAAGGSIGLWDTYLHRDVLREMHTDQRVAVYRANVFSGLRQLYTPWVDGTPGDDIVRCPQQGDYFGACLRWLKRSELGDTMPEVPELARDRLVHYRFRPDRVLMQRGRYSDTERVISDAIFRLAAAHGTKVAWLQMPYGILDARVPLDRVQVPQLLTDQLGRDAPTLAIAPSDLFPGASREEIAHRYYADKDAHHLHYAAASYFTSAIVPGLVEVFRRSMGKPSGKGE